MVVAAAIVAGAVVVPAAASQADEIRVERVRFPPGRTGTVIRDRIVGRNSVSYTVGAEAGQTMSVKLNASNSATYFNVYEPGRGPGDQALANSGLTGPAVPELNRFSAKLPASGTYTVSVYLYRAAARRKEKSSYTLEISVSALDARQRAAPVRGDYADGLQGGPDFWAVTTAKPDGRLVIRSDPSAAAARLGEALNGAILRNLGCRMNEGRRWCRVESTGKVVVSGWAAGDFLREGGPPGDRP